MNVHFDTEAFSSNPRGLISVLHNLKGAGAWSLRHDRDVERVACRTPSLALNLCRFVNGAFGVSREAERVFLKNPGIGIRYLRVVGRREFLDPDTQTRFWRKVSKSPQLSLQWAIAFDRRLPEECEGVFLEDVTAAKTYSFSIIKGPFPERIHNLLILKSFESLGHYQKRCLEEYVRYAASKS